ncbi:hypothetical protein EUX98_g6987 [Antrodiella citrinella]|uniref:Uncharacterized protein n=1 Tax=Antrodiella citrinella TaxID=2447956 RepID=A0A4V3XI19_9APHY|nr:hypothetical protein EUX98_g6987 [Antrodiella citrinella]
MLRSYQPLCNSYLAVHPNLSQPIPDSACAVKFLTSSTQSRREKGPAAHARYATKLLLVDRVITPDPHFTF